MPLIEHAVRLCEHPRIEQVFVVLAPADRQFAACDWRGCEDKLSALYCGGETRAASVFNGLLAANDAIDGNDWVLVHDAARPCLAAIDIDPLISEFGDSEVGGLLAVPVADTLKRANPAGEAVQTEGRDHLWRAQTPQMFRHGRLTRALTQALGEGFEATDEAAAIEGLGLRPRLVLGSSLNIKVTYPGDLALVSAAIRIQRGAR